MADTKQESKTVDAEVVGEVVVDSSALAVITKAEIDTQIATAKAYPRSLADFLQESKTMATLDQATAGKMYYRLKRKSKDGMKLIEGPSIRLAEVAVAAWGHTFVLSRPIAIEDKVVRCQGLAWDLQKNNRRVFEVTRRITDANGRRYSEDMIIVTQQATSQIAARNAIFGVIPRVYIDKLVRDCKEVFLGERKSINEMWKSCLDEYAKLGGKKEDVLKLVGKKGDADIGQEELLDLRGILNAIEDGNLTLQEALAGVSDDNVAEVSTDTLSVESFTKGADVQAQDDAKPEKKAEPEKKADPEPAKVEAKPEPKPEAKKAEPPKQEAKKPAPKPEKPAKEDVAPEDQAIDDLFS